LELARRIYCGWNPPITNKHGPIKIEEHCVIYDLDGWAKSFRNKKLVGQIMGQQGAEMTEKPHLFEFRGELDSSQKRIALVRSLVCVAHKEDDDVEQKVVLDWMPFFDHQKCGLPGPTNIGALDCHGPFEIEKKALLEVLTAGDDNEFGITSRQIVQFSRQKLAPHMPSAQPFGIETLPENVYKFAVTKTSEGKKSSSQC
jgi:hypothetical protein